MGTCSLRFDQAPAGGGAHSGHQPTTLINNASPFPLPTAEGSALLPAAEVSLVASLPVPGEPWGVASGLFKHVSADRLWH